MHWRQTSSRCSRVSRLVEAEREQSLADSKAVAACQAASAVLVDQLWGAWAGWAGWGAWEATLARPATIRESIRSARRRQILSGKDLPPAWADRHLRTDCKESFEAQQPGPPVTLRL